MGIPGDTWTLKELAEYWNSEQGSDPCLDEYASFDDWVEDTIAAMRPVNSSRKPAHKGTRKRLNSSKKSEILELTGWSPDDLAAAFDEWLANGGDEYEEDEQFDAFADAVAEAAELGDTDAFGIPLKASRKMNSSRKVGNNSMRKVIFRGKLNSSRKPAAKGTRKKLNSSWYWDDWDEYCDAIPVTPEMQKAVDTWTDNEGFVVEKALVPRNRKVRALLKGTDAIAMLFTRIPGGTSFDDEAIFGWSGKDVNDDLAPYNLVDILEKAGVNSYEDAMNASRKSARRGTRKKLNSSAADGFEKYFDKVTDQELADYYGIDVKDIIDTNADIEADGYGKVVGHYIPKDEYADVLIDGDWDTLDILEDGTVGFSLGEGGGKATRFYGVDIDSIKEAIAEAGLDSSRKLNSSEEEPGEPAEGVAADGSAAEGVDADGVTAEDNVQDTGIDGGDTAVETAELLDDALIVQNPETKEVSLFVATEEDEALPEFVDVIAEVTPVVEDTILDSSRRLKKFATAKLNSSKGCLNSDAEGVCPGCGNPFDECTCEAGTVAYDEIQLPDDTVVEVENILVVKGEDDDLGLFMPDDADDTVPEDYEVVAVATPVAEVEVLDSSRRLKKAGKKLNSSVKERV